MSSEDDNAMAFFLPQPFGKLSPLQALRRAIAHHQAGRLEYAESMYRDLLKIHPLNVDANHNLGVLALQMNKAAEGLPYLRAALEADPKQSQFWFTYITALIESGQLKEAGQVLAQGQQQGLQGPEAELLSRQLEAAKASDRQDIPQRNGSGHDTTWITNPPRIGECYWKETESLEKGRDQQLCSYFFGMVPTLGITALNQLFSALERTDGSYASDNLVTWERNLSFMSDEKFMKAFETNLVAPTDFGILWRRAVHYWAARHCSGIEGDFVECGVWMGTGAKTVCDAIDFQNTSKCYWLYDAFDYGEDDQHHPLDGIDSTWFDKVNERFSGIKHNVKIIKGYIPDSFKLGKPEKISMLHIDMNNAAAEVAALEHLFPKISTGGIILLDDYGWSYHADQQKAENEYFSLMGHMVLELPTGQGLVIKK